MRVAGASVLAVLGVVVFVLTPPGLYVEGNFVTASLLACAWWVGRRGR